MWKKFLQWEDRIFTAPYKWLINKGYIVSYRVHMKMTDLYITRVLSDHTYRGNPNWAGDD